MSWNRAKRAEGLITVTRQFLLTYLLLFPDAFSFFSASAEPLTKPNTWPAADLFDDGPARVIRLNLSPAGLQSLRKEIREFVPVIVEEGGVAYSNVAVHLKGSVGSFRPLEDKPGFTLDFCRLQPGRKFHGLRRIHLNNSVEDPAYCNEQLGSELFRSADIPAPRVTRALVILNDRKLGLYVLKEAFTEDFLACYFKNLSGNLFEPGEGHDVNQRLKRTNIAAPAQSRELLKALGEASLETDLNRRWMRLQKVLDVERFVRFMALEVMVAHRDGYCLARNNFKVYQDLDSQRMVFLPQGMDQLFGVEELPVEPHMAGLVARSFLEIPAGRQQYSDQFRRLFESLLQSAKLTNRVEQIIQPLEQSLGSAEFDMVRRDARALEQRIVRRSEFIAKALAQPKTAPMDFKNGTADLTDWNPADAPASGAVDKGAGPDGRPCLHIVTRTEAFASWRSNRWLPSGRFRFEGRVKVAGVQPLATGAHQGAGLRVGGQPRQSKDIIGDSSWTDLVAEFEVGRSGAEVEFICELRASCGEAWYDCGSLRVRKME